MSIRDVRCVEFVELATEWMEGALDATQRAGIEEHVTICPDCTIYLTQLHDTITVLRELAEEVPAEPARQRLLSEFRRFHAGD